MSVPQVPAPGPGTGGRPWAAVAAGTGLDTPLGPQPSRPLEIVSAAVPLVISAAVLAGAQAIDLRTETGGIDPRWWPEVLGGSGVVLSAILLAKAALRPPSDRGEAEAGTPQGRKRIVAAVGLCVGMLLLWPYAGFLAGAALVLASLTGLLGGRGWRALVAFPLLTTGFLHLVFVVLLKVPL